MEHAGKRAIAPVVAWSAFAVSAAMVAGTLVITSLRGSSVTAFGTAANLVVLTFSLVGGLIAARRPDNPIGWIFCGVGLSFALAGIASAWADYALVRNPDALPLGRFMAWVSVWAWPPGILMLFTFLLLLFPDGRLPSRRWRPIAWLAGLALIVMVVPIAVTAWPIRGVLLTNIGDNAPAAAPDSFKLAFNIQVAGVLMMFVLGIISAVSLLLRWRRSTGDERQQIKWFAFAAAIVVAVVILASPLVGIAEEFQVLALPLLPIASGIAIFKYRLFDIDVVISKTVVFTALAVFVTAVYLAVVVGIGALIGTTGEPNVVLSIVATAIVALAFQPLRERARRLANHLVYGKRATPYEVLADFAERVGDAYSANDVLPRMAKILGEGTGATRAEVWLHIGRELRRAASWPANEPPARAIALNGDVELPQLPNADHAVAVRHRGELLGALTLRKPPNEPLAPTEERLLDDLAAQAGLVLRNVRLTADLQARLEELRTSRQRLVTAQDHERRRLERNLHDGAQQQLVALAVKARLTQTLVGADEVKERAMLGELQEGLTEALDTLRDLARGIYPPLLADKGLVAALEAQARKTPVPVQVTADGVERYAQEAEAAVYFCCLEALQNIAKYADATGVTIHLSAGDGELAFSVTDDGRGFDVENTELGAGLQNMSDRLAALGGTMDIDSEPGRGTTIMGRLSTPTDPSLA